MNSPKSSRIIRTQASKAKLKKELELTRDYLDDLEMNLAMKLASSSRRKDELDSFRDLASCMFLRSGLNMLCRTSGFPDLIVMRKGLFQE